MRIILYTGKGGVGKTSIAAATAIQLADQGKRVLVMSTDQAHSLADSFDQLLGCEPTRVTPNLDALEIDVVKEAETVWGNLRGYMKEMLATKAEGGIEADELLVFPGLEELFALFKILDIYEQDQYDVLIIDCAPTGETLSLLKYPEMFGDLINKVMPVKRKMAKVAGPLIQKATKIPMPKDSVFADIELLMRKLERLQALMLDKTVVSLRIVTTPEKIVIKETKRNFTWLQLYDYNVDAIIVNKIYPKAALEGYFNPWVHLQEQGMLELSESFQDTPIFSLMLQQQELKGLEVLRTLTNLYGDSDPSLVLASKRIIKVSSDEHGYVLELYMPFADKNDIELEQNNDELHIALQNVKRCFTLPDQLKGKAVVSAKLEQEILRVVFE